MGNSENIDFTNSNISEGDIEKKFSASSSANDKRKRLVRVKDPGEFIKAIDNAKPGDSIFVQRGKYVLNERIYINDSGDADNKIYLMVDTSGERPMLDFFS